MKSLLFTLTLTLILILMAPPVMANGVNLQYVSPAGDDINDGFSWQTAKKTIIAAYDALPQNPSTGFGGGTIYFANGSAIGGEVENQGLWITGPKDPNGYYPPAGWRKQKPLMLIGMPAHSVSNAPGMSQARLIGGSATDPQKPAIWIAGTDVPLHFENVAIMHPAVAIRLGVNNRGRRDIDTSSISFHNVGAAINNVVDNGPTVDIGYVYWVWFTRCVFSANVTEPLSSDKRAAILVKPSRWSTGLLTISDTNFNGGNLKYYTGTSGWGFTIRNVTFEGDFANPLPPAVHILNANQFGNALIENLMVADAPNTEADVKIEGIAARAENIVIINSFPGIISGPATVINRYPANWQNATKTPNSSGQVGFWQGRISGQQDSARRTFGAVAVRFPNLVNQDPQAWASAPGNATVTAGISAPDGTNRAGRLSTNLKERPYRIIFGSYQSLGLGDFVIAGFWVRAASQNGFLFEGQGQVHLSNSNFQFNDRPSSSLILTAPLKGDGEWEWVSVLGKITQVDPSVNNMSDIAFYLFCDRSHPHEFYAPILLHIAAESISDNEAAEIAQHLSSWPNGVEPGSVALLQGQQFVFAPDSNLYRPAPETIKTDGKLIAADGLGVGNATPAVAAGKLVKGIQVFDAAGNPLGFVLVYDSIVISAESKEVKETKLSLPPWDLNKDGSVNIFDLIIVTRSFDRTIIPPTESNPDINADGKVDIFDLILVINHLGEQVELKAAPVRDVDNIDRDLGKRPGKGTWERDLGKGPGKGIGDIDLDLLIQVRDLLKAVSNPNPGILKSISELERLISTRSIHITSKTKSGKSGLWSENGSESVVVKETKLLPNYPNPFNPETWIPYQLANSAAVSLRIYDMSGRLVRSLNIGRKDVGLYLTKDKAVYWDGRNEYGERVSSGIYFYEFSAGKFRSLKKMVIKK